MTFIPSPEIRQLRDLICYRTKLTNMLTGEKNRVWNMLSKLEPYNPDGFLEHRPVNEKKVLTKSQALELFRLRGYTITDD